MFHVPWSKRRREYREALARQQAQNKAQREEDGVPSVRSAGESSATPLEDRSRAHRPSAHEQDRPPAGAPQGASQGREKAEPKVSEFTAVNRRSSSKPCPIPPDAEVIEISPSPSPNSGHPQANQSGLQSKGVPQKRNKPATQPVATPQPLADRQPHTTFKPIKIHTAKCDVCNNHNKSTLHRCVECGWQICTPCWNLRGSGAHGPTRTFTGPVFRESGWSSSREGDTAGPVEDGPSSEARDDNADGEGPELQGLPARRKGNGMTDNGGVSFNIDRDDKSDDIPVSRIHSTTLLARNEHLEDSIKVPSIIKGGFGDGNRDILLGGTSVHGKREFRALTPNSKESMNNLVTAAERVLGGKVTEVPPGLSAMGVQNRLHAPAAPRSPLFVPAERETHSDARKPVANTISLAGLKNQEDAEFKKTGESDRALPQVSSSACLTSKTGATEATTAARLPPMGEISTGSPRPYKRRRTLDSGRSAQGSTPPGSTRQCDDPGHVFDVPLRPVNRQNTRGRAWEL